MNEIEKKFIINKLPDIDLGDKVTYKRYFIYSNNGVEIRVQQKGEQYELERKEKISNLTSKKDKIIITYEEFEYFKSISTKEIIRDSYILHENDTEISLKIYHGNFEGLIRAEVEFETEQDANNFEIPSWLGREITETKLGKDSKLIALSNEEFLYELNKHLGGNTK